MLVMDLPLSEGTGVLANDQSGFGHHHELTTAWTGSERGYALQFNDADSTSLTATSNCSAFEAMTACVWIRMDTFVSSDAVFGHYSSVGNQRSWLMLSTTPDSLRVLLSPDGTLSATYKDYRSSLTAFDGAFHLLGFTFDRGQLELYIDGQRDLSPTKTRDDAVTQLHNSTAAIQLGRFDATILTDAVISSAKVWARALSPPEMWQEYVETFPVRA